MLLNPGSCVFKKLDAGIHLELVEGNVGPFVVSERAELNDVLLIGAGVVADGSFQVAVVNSMDVLARGTKSS